MLGLLKVNEVFVLAKDYSKLRDLSTRPTSVFFTNLFLWRLLADWPAVEPWEALYIYKAGLAAEESISSLRCALAMFNFFWIISFCGKFYHFTLCNQHHQVFFVDIRTNIASWHWHITTNNPVIKVPPPNPPTLNPPETDNWERKIYVYEKRSHMT